MVGEGGAKLTSSPNAVPGDRGNTRVEEDKKDLIMSWSLCVRLTGPECGGRDLGRGGGSPVVTFMVGIGFSSENMKY